MSKVAGVTPGPKRLRADVPTRLAHSPFANFGQGGVVLEECQATRWQEPEVLNDCIEEWCFPLLTSQELPDLEWAGGE